jgi:hypothetical protein
MNPFCFSVLLIQEREKGFDENMKTMLKKGRKGVEKGGRTETGQN